MVVRSGALSSVCTPQKHAMQLLPAIMLLCLTSPVRGLYLRTPCSTTLDNFAGEEAWGPEGRHLSPLGVLQQLRSQALDELAGLGSCLVSALRNLTALTALSLHVSVDSMAASEHCEVFEAVAAMTQLEECHIFGHTRTHVQRLPDEMSCLTRLRRLDR